MRDSQVQLLEHKSLFTLCPQLERTPKPAPLGMVACCIVEELNQNRSHCVFIELCICVLASAWT